MDDSVNIIDDLYYKEEVYNIVKCAFNVYNTLGFGFLEADKLFCLPGVENTAYAAVLYAEASGKDVVSAWSASSVADVLAFRI